MAKGGIWKFMAGVVVAYWIFGGDDDPQQTKTVSIQPTTTLQTIKPIAKPSPISVPQPNTTSKLRQQLETKIKKDNPKPTYSPKSMYVDASRLNVRNGPDKTNKVVWTLKRDQKVLVINKSGDWLQVKGNRFSGWVFGTYLTNNPAPKPQIAKRKASTNSGLSTSKIKNLLIKRSHAYYSGNCPCPYNTTRAGRRCGKRSAYSRPGGASPLCYPSDVSASMVAEYRARQ